MEVSTITGKGQTTIPARIRQWLKVNPGDKVRYHIDDRGNVVLKAASGSVKDLRRVISPSRRHVTEAEMATEMEQGVAEHVLGYDRD